MKFSENKFKVLHLWGRNEIYKYRVKNIRLGSSMAKKISRVIVDHFGSTKCCHSRRTHLFCSVQQVLGQDWRGDVFFLIQHWVWLLLEYLTSLFGMSLWRCRQTVEKPEQGNKKSEIFRKQCKIEKAGKSRVCLFILLLERMQQNNYLPVLRSLL